MLLAALAGQCRSDLEDDRSITVAANAVDDAASLVGRVHQPV
jgi:hypothetical protein